MGGIGGGAARPGRARSPRRARRLAALLGPAALLVSAATGCGLTVPTDPDGTLDDARGGVLRVGVSPEPGLIDLSASGADGPLARLVEGFGDRIDASVRWVEGSEETLVEMLEAGSVDVAVGGFGEGTPWADRVGVSRGYEVGPAGGDDAVTVLVPLGENALLSALETYLDEEAGS